MYEYVIERFRLNGRREEIEKEIVYECNTQVEAVEKFWELRPLRVDEFDNYRLIVMSSGKLIYDTSYSE